MNPLDVWFLHLEDDSDQLHIGSVGVFEGPTPPFAEMLDLVERKLPKVPRYRQRVQRVPMDLARPIWVDDPDFALSYHVRHTALPAPGGDAELQALVGRLMSQPLDHRRPMWEMWQIDGLSDGRWAVVSKVHHCLVDGIAGTDLVATILNLTPDEEPGAWQPWTPVPGPSTAALVRDAAGERLEEIGGLVRGFGSALRRPGRSLDTATSYARGAAELLRLGRFPSRTSLNGPIGPHRRWMWASTTHDDVRQVQAAFGVKHNDVVLAAIARGFRDLLRERHELGEVSELRTIVPVSLRGTGDGQMDNKVSAMFTSLPVGEGDAVARLTAVSSEMVRLKGSGEADATALLVASTSLAPPWVMRLGLGALTRIVQRTGQRAVNTVTTNVPGPPVPLYLLGRRLMEIHPYVPIAEGLRVGIAIYTYDGNISFGLTGDTATTEDLGVLARGIEDGVRELVLASTRRPTHREVV